MPEVNRFEINPEWSWLICGVHGEFHGVNRCPECAKDPKPKPALQITGVDHDRGVVTLGTVDE